MPPTGFEPATYCLEGSRSIQAELQGLHYYNHNNLFKSFLSIIIMEDDLVRVVCSKEKEEIYCLIGSNIYKKEYKGKE